jgi:hypothetical protein
MNSLKLLYEMFLADARFPDEKFWNKDGSPIHPEPKGPPRGTRGMTHGDVGAKDQDDQLDFSNDGNNKAGQVGNYDGSDIYPNIDTVKETPDAYHALQGVLKDLGMTEEQLPETAFLFDEDGNLTVTIPGGPNDDDTELIWDLNGTGPKSWEYNI